MMLLKIAFRNILRNSRRSLMTMSAVAVGAIALIIFGEFMAYLVVGFQTTTVEETGHLSVFHQGYFEFGAGNPAAYGIGDYQTVIGLIQDDVVLKPMLRVVTPTVKLFGIAGNFDINASTTFLGMGVVPSDRSRMLLWDEYHIQRGGGRVPTELGLRDDPPTRGVIGVGLARILGLCKQLGVASCPSPPVEAATAAPDAPGPTVDLSELARRDRSAGQASGEGGVPRIDLLAATAGGAPNVLSLYVSKAERQSVKELDDTFVAMNLALAQQLLYGRGEHKAVGIVLQLNRTEDIVPARARLRSLFKEHHLDLDVRDFTELQPQYNQIVGLFGAIFFFIAIVMGVIVLFTIVNTMSMSVMERTNEIGTARAMGVRRSGIRRQFLIEGWMLGVIGATAGLIVSASIAFAVNHAGLRWMPPGQAAPIPLKVLTSGVELLIVAVWLGLMLMATVAALIPANRAARMPVVDALRHV
jgi:putative ABC transport system permease protein